MIKITVDTADEAAVVRRVLKTETCFHRTCERDDNVNCSECVKGYLKDHVQLCKKEIVETPTPIAL